MTATEEKGTARDASELHGEGTTHITNALEAFAYADYDAAERHAALFIANILSIRESLEVGSNGRR